MSRLSFVVWFWETRFVLSYYQFEFCFRKFVDLKLEAIKNNILVLRKWYNWDPWRSSGWNSSSKLQILQLYEQGPQSFNWKIIAAIDNIAPFKTEYLKGNLYNL